MQNPGDELNKMLSDIPTYSSWKAEELEKVFIRYREIVVELVESEDYRNFKWLADYCPDLGGRIHLMLAEKETDKQGRQFNNIVFELQCAIEVIAGIFECNDREEWNSLVLRVLPKIA